MRILIFIIGGFFAVTGFYQKSTFSPVLFVEGMILINYALLNYRSKSINHL